MRNAKLWSVLLAAVLLCACVAGVLFTGISASTVTVPYAVDGTEYASVKDAIAAAKTRAWAANEVMEITLSIADTSADVTTPAAGESANLLFGQTTIFRADGSKLPIIIQGSGSTASVAGPAKKVACANDYTFKNLTYNIAGTACVFYAGSGNVTFEKVSFSKTTGYFYADNFTQDAFAGWDEPEAGEFVETSITFGEGVKYTYNSSNASPISAVGYSPAGTTFGATKSYLKSDGTLDQAKVDAALAEAKSLTFEAATNGLDCADIRPVNTKTTFTVDNRIYDVQATPKMRVRKGTSPVACSTAEYKRTFSYGMTADVHSDNVMETYVGDIRMVLDGCKIVDSAIWFRGLDNSNLIGNFTAEIHDTPDDGFETKLVLFQGSHNSPLTIGNYEFIMTGGTLGDGSTANDGYWGCGNVTGTVTNRVSGGNIWQFGGIRHQNNFANTPISVSDGTEGGFKTEKKVNIHNIITGGTFGGETAANTEILAVGGFHGLSHGKGTTLSKAVSVCNEISGGTFYKYTGGENAIKASAGHEVINQVTGGTFLANYHGGGATLEYTKEGASKATTYSSKAASSITNYIRGGDFKSKYYGSRQSADSVINVVTGGTFVNYCGTYYGTIGTAKNYIKGGTFSKATRLIDHGTVSQITNEMTGGTFNSTFDCTYVTTFDTIKNYFKGGAFTGGTYSCYGADSVHMGDVYNYITGGTFTGNNCLFGGYGGLSTKSVTNEVSGNPQFLTVPKKVDEGVYFGAGSFMWPSKVLGNVTTTIQAGTFVNYVYGGGQAGYTLGNIETYIEAGTFERDVFGANYGSCSSNKDKTYLQDDFGKICAGTVKTVFGKADGSTKPLLKANFFGGENENSSAATTEGYDILNIVYDAEFNGGVFHGGSDAGIVKSVRNEIYGGTFYGNASAYCARFGGYKATVTGGIVNVIEGGEFKSYVFGGCASGSIQNSTAGEPAIKNVISGGTFHNFWGANAADNKIVGDVVNEISGGTFETYKDSTGGIYPNCFSGGNRNSAHAGGNVINKISGGVFTSRFVAGNNSHNTTLDLEDVAPAYSVTTDITGGIFKDSVYANENTATTSDTAFRYATATLNVVQTAGKALEFYGQVLECDSFTANGAEIKIGAKTNIVIENFEGEILVNQTEGWLAHDYLTLPADAQVTVTESPEIYGSYALDQTTDPSVKRYYGASFAPAGATIRLAERLGVRFLLNKTDVDVYGDAFTFAVKLGDTTLISGGKAELEDYQGYYSFFFDGIGLTDFATDFILSGSCFADEAYSIAGLATIAESEWAETYPAWAEYAAAIIELSNVYNGGANNSCTPAAVEKTPVAAKGDAGVKSASATLLMSDAAGVRITAIVEGEVENAKLKIGEKEISATVTQETVDEAVVSTITADVFFAHEYLAEEFALSVESDAGVHMTYTASIEAIAAQLANDDANEMQNNAIAFLYYIQKAVACK